MHYDTPTKFAARSSNGEVKPSPPVDRERIRLGIAEHKRFERAAESLFARNEIRKRNAENERFVRLFIALTVGGGFILFILA